MTTGGFAGSSASRVSLCFLSGFALPCSVAGSSSSSVQGSSAGTSSASCDVCSGSFEALTTGVSTGSAAGGTVSSASCGFSAAFSALPTGAGSAGGCSCCAGGVSAGSSSIISTTSTTSSSGSSLFFAFSSWFCIAPVDSPLSDSFLSGSGGVIISRSESNGRLNSSRMTDSERSPRPMLRAMPLNSFCRAFSISGSSLA